MSEFIGGTLIFGSFAVFFISVFALFKPIKRLMLGSRKRAALGIVSSFAMIIVGGMLIPQPTPEQIAEREAADAQRSAAQKASTEAAAADAQAASAAEKTEVATAVKGMWTEINTQLASCDQAGGYVAETAGRSNPNVYDIYPMVQQAETLCRQAAANVGRITVPDTIPREFRRGFEESFKTCRDAYYLKSSAYSSMAKVLDGDARPSAVTEARSAAEASQTSSLRCAAGFMKSALEAGVQTGEFMDLPADEAAD